MCSTRHVLAAVAAALVPACDDADPPVEIDIVGETVEEGRARGAALVDFSSSELGGDPSEVLGRTATILATINDSRMVEAVFVTNVLPPGRSFDIADEIFDDHDAANVALDGAVRTLGIGFLPSSTADLLGADSAEQVRLMRATPPNDLDFIYLRTQILVHAESQLLLDELATVIGSGPMFDYITSTRAMEDEHLADLTDRLDDFYD